MSIDNMQFGFMPGKATTDAKRGGEMGFAEAGCR